MRPVIFAACAIALMLALSGCAVAINIGNVSSANGPVPFTRADPLSGVKACKP